MQKKGLTLIELIIVMAIIAVLASMVVANIASSKMSANESTAITHLRQIGLIQAEIRLKGLVDQDNDTIGEYALLGEICGNVPIRSLGEKDRSLSNIYGPKSGTKYGEKDGYCFQIFLPSASGSTVVTDNGITTPTSVSANANNQENRYRCYAWPVKAGKTGNRAFAIDQRGVVFGTANIKNSKAYYNGTTTMPLYNAASPANDSPEFVQEFKAGTGNDGLTWYEVK